MAKVVVMPKLGLTMTEGLIGTWYKKEGEAVTDGENLFGVETDKLTNDIESTETGIVRKILFPAGETVACLEPVAIIAAADEDISNLLTVKEKAPQSNTPQKSEVVQKTKTSEKRGVGARIIAAPAAKKLAAEKDVDLAQIQGTGPKGRITLKDVEDFLAAPESKSTKASPMAKKLAEQKGIDLTDIAVTGRVMKQDVLDYTVSENAEALEERIPMNGMRKVIAKRMTESWTSPTVTFDIVVDVSKLADLKAALKEQCKVSYTDMLIKFVSKALMEYPLLNCSIDGDEIILKKYVNMGVAVAIEDGLLVPTIKNADKKGLAAIAKEVKQLAVDAREGKLSPDALVGGTFTISNLGMYGIDAFSPIINQPEVAILGVNAIREELCLKDGVVVSKPVMKLSLTADHRAVDGAVAAAFLKRLRELLENPGMMLL